MEDLTFHKQGMSSKMDVLRPQNQGMSSKMDVLTLHKQGMRKKREVMQTLHGKEMSEREALMRPQNRGIIYKLMGLETLQEQEMSKRKEVLRPRNGEISDLVEALQKLQKQKMGKQTEILQRLGKLGKSIELEDLTLQKHGMWTPKMEVTSLQKRGTSKKTYHSIRDAIDNVSREIPLVKRMRTLIISEKGKTKDIRRKIHVERKKDKQMLQCDSIMMDVPDPISHRSQEEKNEESCWVPNSYFSNGILNYEEMKIVEAILGEVVEKEVEEALQELTGIRYQHELVTCCSNAIASDELVDGFHDIEQYKKVGVDANQIQSSDLLQVSKEKGKNVVVISGDAIKRKMDGEKLLSNIEVFCDEDPLQEIENIKEEADSVYNEEEEEEECHPPFRHVRNHHALELTDDLDQHELITCSACKLNIAPYQCHYACKACSHYLHLDCSHKFPETVRQTITDRNHDFTLRYPSSNTTFKCEACGEQGDGFYYHCPQCVTNYHIHCLNMPLSIIHQAHPHELKLEASTPYKGPKAFLCDVCNAPGFDNWLYRCDKCGFDFDVHLGCSTSNPGTQSQLQNQPKSKNEAETILRNITTSAHLGCATTSPGTQSQLQDQSKSSEIESGKKLMDIIPSGVGPSKSSPQINPEFDVGIRCGNIIAPNRAMRGFHNEQHKQVSAQANQTNHSDILQVSSENGTNAAVLTGEATERKMNGMSNKVSDSTKPRTEPKRKSGCWRWFRCFCYCHMGPMEDVHINLS